MLKALAVSTEAFGIALLLPLLHMIETAGMQRAGDVTGATGDTGASAGETAVAGVSLKIDVNSRVAFFAPSGAGKSTLIDMITMLVAPQQGTLLIDDAPHQQIDRGSWRRQIGFVPQDPVLFDDTIANNISLWSGDGREVSGWNGVHPGPDDRSDDAFRSRIEDAAERSNALDFILELPDGFDTLVGDRAIRLSGGQVQRLMIARELFKDAAWTGLGG